MIAVAFGGQAGFHPVLLAAGIVAHVGVAHGRQFTGGVVRGVSGGLGAVDHNVGGLFRQHCGGQFAHAITDTGDTVGTMLLFPWTFHFHLGAWAYAGQTGRTTDAAAYFSGLGCMWDLVFVVYGLWSWRVLTSNYFDNYIYRADAFWPWLNRWVPRGAMVTLYRAAFFYGTSRWIAWTVWAHVIHHYPYDLSWGGPHWVPAAHP